MTLPVDKFMRLGEQSIVRRFGEDAMRAPALAEYAAHLRSFAHEIEPRDTKAMDAAGAFETDEPDDDTARHDKRGDG